MRFTLPPLFLGLFLTVLPAVQGWLKTQEAIDGGQKTKHSVVLDINTAQELGHFSAKASSHFCVSAITTLNDSSSRFYGISGIILKTELMNGDYIDIEFYDTGRSPQSSEFPVHTSQWRMNSSYSPSASKLEFKWTKGEICIRPKGEWKLSWADILFTLYYDNEMSQDPNYCPSGMALCKCQSYRKAGKDNKDSEEESDEDHSHRFPIVKNRCIVKHLFCNGIRNCGQNCPYDESAKICRDYSDDSDPFYTEACVWTDFDYLLMLVMTGLLFILVPIVFFFIMMYHRKFTASGRLLNGVPLSTFNTLDGNNNAEHNPHVRHSISTVPAFVDQPPAYEDLPVNVKTVATP
ncbi:hypothetical protein Ocin01_05822 [Orchesella cincta]|uniref:Uncharacterized protein n=1 Tax=Orchesella cincta TaxID=48709 RepID=A0A1D2N6N0_ORCCI|nr:hypothetical protein Ocin01_05822 [Orchesella cincta]